MVEVPITTRKLPSLRAHTQWTGSDKQGSKRIEQVNPTHVDMLALTLLSYNSSVWIKTEAYGKESDKFANHQNEMKTRQNHMQESVVHHELVVQQVLVQNIHWSPGPKDNGFEDFANSFGASSVFTSSSSPVRAFRVKNWGNIFTSSFAP